MTIGTVIYLFILIVAVFVSIICLEYGTVALLGALILVPLFMLFFVILLKRSTTAEVDCRNPLAEKDSLEGEATPTILLNLENKSRFLPVQKGVAWITYENHFSGERGRKKVRFSVDVGKKRSRRIPIPIQHCGNVSVKVNRVKVYDYMDLFALTIGRDYDPQDVLIMPPLTEIYLGENRLFRETNEDSDRFSLYKKGDDPSEIFDIRDYKEGDRFQQIHWKLTRKVGHLMVKEGSLPLARAVNIFIDLCAENGDQADRLIQGVYSISMDLFSRHIPQKFIWYDKENGLIQEALVEQEEELYWMFEELFKCQISQDPNELVEAYFEWEGGRGMEMGLYLTVADHQETNFDVLEVADLTIMDLGGREDEAE